MTRISLVFVFLAAMAAMCVAQMPAGHAQAGDWITSSRTEFGAACGIQDTSTDSSSGFAHSRDGQWSEVSAELGGGPGDDLMARLWRETNWMVDLHTALGPGMSTMHTGQMCFDGDGHITRMVDRYMDMQQCGCIRFTDLAFAGDGRVTRRQQRFVNANTGEDINSPQVAESFPEVWEFRRVDQLPFYSLLKK